MFKRKKNKVILTFTFSPILNHHSLQTCIQMFTVDQIKAAHSKVKSGADFPAYAKELKNMGIHSYDFIVDSGESVYYGEDNYSVTRESNLPAQIVSDNASKDGLKNALAIHQQGKTDFPVFRKQAAEAGVARWTTDLDHMEVVYISKQEKVMLAETIPA